MRSISFVALAVALCSLAPAARAQTASLPMTVDGVNVTQTTIRVTGVVQGESAPSVRSFSVYATASDAVKVGALDRCHRSLLLALAKPGQYVAFIGPDTCAIELIAP